MDKIELHAFFAKQCKCIPCGRFYPNTTTTYARRWKNEQTMQGDGRLCKFPLFEYCFDLNKNTFLRIVSWILYCLCACVLSVVFVEFQLSAHLHNLNFIYFLIHVILLLFPMVVVVFARWQSNKCNKSTAREKERENAFKTLKAKNIVLGRILTFHAAGAD